MRRTEIHLSEPFEKVLASVLRLPSTLAEIDEVRLAGAADSGLRKSAKCGAEVNEALRSLYEAAHGRQVERQIGFVTIAPPVAGFRKKKPYYVATQHDFFLEAFTRVLAGASPRQDRANGSWTSRGSRRGINAPRRHTRKENRNVFPCPTSSQLTSNHSLTRP
jgi:hypothetical protein